MIKNLFDVALLFEAAELGGSKDRPPAAMSLDEGGVLNQDRAFEERGQKGSGPRWGGQMRLLKDGRFIFLEVVAVDFADVVTLFSHPLRAKLARKLA